MKELALIPIIIIILIFIFRFQINHIIDSLYSKINQQIKKINYGDTHRMLYSY